MYRFNRPALYTLSFAAALALVGCEPAASDDDDVIGNDDDATDDDDDVETDNSIIGVAAAAGDFATLVAAVDAAGLTDTLTNDGPFTVVAPTDAAFAALPDGTVDALLADIPTLTDILLYHVVDGEAPASAVVESSLIATLQGSSFKVTVDADSNVFINDALITVVDIEADNGIIHVIDAVLTPPASIAEIASSNPDFSTLVAAADAAGLVDTLTNDGPFTIFAPTNAAFDALPDGTVEALLNDIPTLTDILLYHVVAGDFPAADVVTSSLVGTLQGTDFKVSLDGGVFVNGAQVTVTDIPASNGIIHVIDAVITPPKSIAEIAIETPALSTLVEAVVAADLATTLTNDGPFTVFAPTNAAFDALPEGTLEALLNDIPALTNVLLYHVAGEKLAAVDVVGSASVTTLQGSNAPIVIDGDVVTVAGAVISVTDIPAANGVVHVIDAVMLPPQ